MEHKRGIGLKPSERECVHLLDGLVRAVRICMFFRKSTLAGVFSVILLWDRVSFCERKIVGGPPFITFHA